MGESTHGRGKAGSVRISFLFTGLCIWGSDCLLDVHAFLSLMRPGNNSPASLPSLPFTAVQTLAEPIKMCLHSMSLWIKWSPLIRG